MNPNQSNAIDRHYNKLVNGRSGLLPCTVPKYNPSELNNPLRRQEILSELIESKADTIILLGDLPIRCFLSFFIKDNIKKLSQFGYDIHTYGKIHNFEIAGKNYNVIPLVHPRQAGKLGRSDATWNQLHNDWVKIQCPIIS